MSKNIRETLAELVPEALLADGFDEAILGIAERCGQPPLVAYSVDRCVEILVEQGLSPEEAEEFIDSNSVGAWVGEGTPVWIRGL